jgi:hypothetical protein
VSTQGDDGRRLLATGYANFKRDQQLGSAVLHVPGRGEPSLVVTQLDLSENAVTNDQRDAALGLLACGLDIASELKDQLRVGDGCLEWQVSDAKVKAALELAQGFRPIDASSKRAKRLRGRRLLRRC